MRARAMLLVACVTLAGGFAPAPLPRKPTPNAPPDDLAKMQGTWDVVSWRYQELGRDKVFTDGSTRYEVRIVGNRWGINETTDPRPRLQYVIFLDPTSHPRTFDRSWALEGGSIVECPGVYRLDGDSLTICYTHCAERPTRFDGPGTYWLLTLLKRPKR